MTNTSPQAPISYDMRALRHGIFFDYVRSKKIGGYVALLTIIFIVGPIILGQVAPGILGTYRPTPLAAYSVLAPVGVVFLAWFSFMDEWLRQRVYNRGVARFAEANSLTPLDEQELFQHIPPSVRRPGSYNHKVAGYSFSLDHTKVIIFDYSYSVGSGKNRENYAFAVACITLSKQYPHVFLDGHANGKNDHYARSQRLELEGDFSKYFDMYMPEGAAAGALTVLSPDVMQTLIDQGRPFDLELQGYDVAIMTPGFAYTRENLQRLLSCCKVLAKEFGELDASWRPVLAADGKPFELRQRNLMLRTVATVVASIVVYVAFRLMHSRASGR